MCKSRKQVTLGVVVLSALSGLCGILTIFGTLGIGESQQVQAAQADVAQISTSVKGGQAALNSHGIAMCVMCGLGVATYKIKSKTYLLVFGIVLGFVWLGSFITGLIFSATAIGAPMLANGICAQSVDGYLGFGPKLIVNNYMCTQACPCVPAAQSVLEQENMTFFNNFNRTSVVGTEYDANGYLQMYYESYSSQPRFTTFEACWNSRLSTHNTTNGPLFNKTTVDQMNGFLKVMNMFETNFACSGVCMPNLFWFTRPLTNPVPKIPCLSRMTDIVSQKFTFPGVCLFIGSFFLLLVFIWQYLLWCKKDDE